MGIDLAVDYGVDGLGWIVEWLDPIGSQVVYR